MNVEIDRVTLIHPAKTDEHTIECAARVSFTGPDVSVEVPTTADFPDWDGRGVDVVAAHDDGTVATAFTAITVRRGIEFPDLPGTWRVYHGTR